MRDHDAVVAERDGVTVAVLSGAEGIDEAVALLDAAEAVVGSPLVDEVERERLHALVAHAERPGHWHSLLARRDGTAVGYAGLVLPTVADDPAVADLAVARDPGPSRPALTALLAGLEALVRDHTPQRLQVWIRHAQDDDITAAAAEGYRVERRLAVLGRHLDDAAVAAPDVHGHRVRAYRPDLDDAGVVEVLRDTYAGTPDAGWDRARFLERRGWSWFRPEDLLVAEDATGSISGVHWLKRRSSRVGEVYNLAIHPRAQGTGLGPVLLAAGLAHLRLVGCDEVLLWVDLDNHRAVRLYTSHGFERRWQDVALERHSGPRWSR